MLEKSCQKAMAIRSTGRGARSALAIADALADPMRSVSDGFAGPLSAACPSWVTFLRSMTTDLTGACSVEQPVGRREPPPRGPALGRADGKKAERFLSLAPA